ncbi:Alpha/Beta hydrolase protein [Coprinopsis sp. MPI-PUGE-AT-0042]|nr:Alpha/Beta hydrolase protein [Coprinopsis sp. MPI-PUGE-AT-0042]
MKFPIPLLGLSAQVPMGIPQSSKPAPAMSSKNSEFSWKEGKDTFSPRDLVSLGRPGSAIPNGDGDLAFVQYSKFDLDEKKNHKSFFIVALDGSDAKPLQIPLKKGGDVFWLDSRTIANVVPGSEGSDGAELHALDISFDTAALKVEAVGEPQIVGTFPTNSPANFVYKPDAAYLVFSENVYEDGNLTTVNEQDEAWKNRGTTGLVYDATFERHWDEWIGPKSAQLFSVALAKEDGKWKLGADYNSPLHGTGHHSPVEPFGGTDDFDVSAATQKIVYTAKDPKLPKAMHTKQNIYVVDIKGESPPKELTSGEQGATHNPVFNNAGNKVAWLELDKDGYESDRAKIVIYDLEKDVRFTVTEPWDRSADGLVFSKDDKFLYLTGGDEAKVKVWALPVAATPEESTTQPRLDKKYSIPVALTHSHAAGDVKLLPNGRLLFSQSSLTSPKDAFVIEDLGSIEKAILDGNLDSLKNVKPTRLTHFAKESLEGKHMSEGEEFWFKGAKDRQVQGWALKPKGWKSGEKKKYPAVLLIHGGPQGAWEDQWSTRWNPNVFANQGYFTIMINPTGSTTFGQGFTDAITEDWGGKPFVDMINGWKYALENFPEIDSDRTVAAGASWGGYAINWIQGHPEYGFGFKVKFALVCHDGVFDSNYNGYSTDELFFFNHDWGGRPWDPKSRELLQRMSPANFVHKWSTPQMLIHGSKDYRLAETESIGAFHALQQLGIPSRLVIFPDENHWVQNHGNSLKWHYEVFRWFDQFVGEKADQ